MLDALMTLIDQGLIEIDSQGQVRRRKVWNQAGKHRTLKTPKIMGRLLPGEGYLSFHFRAYGKQYQCLNHVAVYSFFCRKPKRTEVILHKDGNLLNNHPANLELATRKELVGINPLYFRSFT